jgi:poly(3-hydroxybutyrate) depolymerase
MNRRGIALVFVLGILALPAAAVLFGATRHYLENRTTGTIVVFGITRPYILHVPDRYDPTKPTALVISMHGAMNWPAFQMRVSGWNRVADEEGFIVAYPAGEGAGPAVWHLRGRTAEGMPDVVFISQLIDKLRAIYNIDPARIYANGLSNGGGMSFALSCRMSQRIAAVGLVAAAHLVPWDGGHVHAVSRRKSVDRAERLSEHSQMDRELGAAQSLRAESGRVRIGRERYETRVHGLRR